MNQMPQPMRPHGPADHVFGFVMERISAPNYRWVMSQLTPLHPQSYLEIGFGTGKLALLVARKLQPHRLVGVDPSEQAVKLAKRKLVAFAEHSMIELKLGDDSLVASLGGPFEAITATHSFQFWRNPMATLARVHALLSPDGLLVLVLRKHVKRKGKVMKWLPNPITRSSDEIGGARQALSDAGFYITADRKLGPRSHGLVARVL